MVEINLQDLRGQAPVLAVALVVAILALGLLGAAVTPVGAQARVMTPDRWAAAALARQARTETEALLSDADELRAVLEQDRPDPVTAMLLAERLYARHNQGTSATGGARQALIAAAEATARYAVGELSRQVAGSSYNEAQALIGMLATAPMEDAKTSSVPITAPAPMLAHRLFLPHLITAKRPPENRAQGRILFTAPAP